MNIHRLYGVLTCKLLNSHEPTDSHARTAKEVKAQSILQHQNTTIQPTTLPRKINTVDATLTVNLEAVLSTADPNMMIQPTAHLKKTNTDQTMEVMVHLTITTTPVDPLAAAVLVLLKILK